jgi:hypothetical protein
MNKPFVIDLFTEDRAHEEWIRPLLEGLAMEEKALVRVRVRSARGGHGRVFAELKTYQQGFEKGIGGSMPDLLVAAVDANCSTFVEAQNKIQEVLRPEFQGCTVKATPDPHIERWFLADLETFHAVVGITPEIEAGKCVRDYYKTMLAKAFEEAGHPPTLGGIEFARELVYALDYFRAGKADNSLKHFLEEIRGRFKTVKR